jgi:hypothetical protein
MFTLESDLKYVESALPVLDEFILSNDLYWPLAGSPRGTGSEQLSLGMLEVMEMRLLALPETHPLRRKAIPLYAQMDIILHQWQSNYRQKAVREWHARLRQWQTYLGELRHNPYQWHTYAYEVRLRVILDVFADWVELADREVLHGLDGVVLNAFAEGHFIWEPEVAAGFSSSRYPYLYIQLPEKKSNP